MAKKLMMAIAMVALVLSFTVLGFSQASSESSVKGNLAGVVNDQTGAVIQGAHVVLTGPIGEKTATTDSEGRFAFSLLTPGFYSVKITKDGFKTSEIKQAEVVTGRTSAVTLKMELGASSTTVEVTAGAIAVDTTSSSTSSNLTDNFYGSVPVGRGVTGLFYAAPGVSSGGGTGTANPSIAGGTGLENNYVADGVSITDAGFGGIGVFSRVYGSLSTGINLSFVKEVQVKTGGFEAQYGKSTGGIVQIVTKSGTNQWHGSIGGYFAPQQLERERLFSDSAGRFNLQGKILHQSNYDLDVQVGGPLIKNRLFVFGSFNPQWNTDHDQFAQYVNPSDSGTGGEGGFTQTSLGKFDVPVKVYSYAGKATFRLNDNNQLEATIFGDPTYGENRSNGIAAPQTASDTTFDKLQYGTRNFAGRYNGTLSPTWLLNASFAWGHNNLNDTPGAPGVHQIVDFTQRTPCGSPFFNADCTDTQNPLRGQFTRQGLGYYENTKGDNYSYAFDTSKTLNFLGQHNVTFGYRYDQSHYDGTKFRSGATIPVTQAFADSQFSSDNPLNAALVANGTNGAFQLRSRAGSCIENAPNLESASEIYVPGLANCEDGGLGVQLRQTRGEFGLLDFKTTSNYHVVFAQDSWSINKYVTINAGLRWEQQHVKGVSAGYTFTDNWSPRVGFTVDPWGNRKTKITANFGRYNEALPLDIAIRSLSAEFDFPDSRWVPPTDGAGHVVLDSGGVIDLSGLVADTTPRTNGGFIGALNSGASASLAVAIAPGTKTQYLDEFTVGFEHEFGNSGVIFSARYNDRRIKRIVEDLAALSPEAAQTGLTQQYFIGNPSKTTDYFTNPQQIFYNSADFPGTVPGCGVLTDADPSDDFYTQPTDSNGNLVLDSAGHDSLCIGVPAGGTIYPPPCALATPQRAGDPCPDGIADGFVNAVRKYQAVEFEVNKSMSKGWQLRANYRIAKLQGNYEGTFRNDNNQSDPNISSLFDFTRGDLNLLGQQFNVGVLNQDVHHLANGYVSYLFSGNHLKGLTMGTSVHFQTGIPINNLFAHPVYANAGEIPFCADNTTNCASARGALGRTSNWGSVDYHADYPIRISEGSKLRLGIDLFNISNNRTQLRVDQLAQRTVGVPNADFLKPTGIGPSAVNGNTNPAYQRPFYARFSVKWEF